MQPTFMEMMGVLTTGIHPAKDGLAFDFYDEQMLLFLEAEYKKKIPLLKTVQTPKIPNIIHFIWIGPKPFPEESIKNVLSWKALNPTWQLYFWTDSENRPCPVEGMKRKLVSNYDFGPLKKYIDQSTNWGEKSDLMRYMLIHDFGGFYVDHDSICLCSFEPFLQFDSVICCEEPEWRPAMYGSALLFQNSSFGACPHHRFLKATIQNVQHLWPALDALYPDNNQPTPSWKVLRRTFNSFTIAVKQELTKTGSPQKFHDLILPTCYFFPNRILSEEDTRAFEEKGVVWSSHTYTGLWAEGAWGTFYYD